jgi:23S rRNA (adenine2503-C2)-methyltransferase
MALDELEALFDAMGEPRYRADQIAAWIYTRGVTDFNLMTDLSLPLREQLAETATVCLADVVASERSSIDGTEKLLLEYDDGERIECVILRDDERTTGCVSTQVGCRFGCTFCATGAMGFRRNLTAGEIVEQIVTLRRHVAPERLDNIVFMGMGEPLDNYDATMKAIRIANAPWGLGIGARHIAVSTAGLIPGIERLAGEGLQLNLAVSLNAPVQKLRRELMPIAERYPLHALMASLHEFVARAGRHVTLEYVLLSEINDSPEMARMLAELARDLACKINVICYNEISGGAYSPPADRAVERFLSILRARCPTVVRRASRGSDIAAGCGQLRVGTGHAR